MILIENPDKFAEFQECEGWNIAEQTSRGWVVVAIIDHTELARENCNVGYYDRDGHRNTSYEDVHAVVKKPRYLLGLHRDKALEQLREKNSALREESEKQRASLESMAIDLSGKEDDIKRLHASLTREQDATSKARENLKTAVEKNSVMEDHLGKLRQAIGDLKFKEITEVA